MPASSAPLVSVVIALQAFVWYRAGAWLEIAALLGTVGLGISLGLPLVRRFLRPSVYDMDLVREKISRVAYRAELRVAVFAPAGETQAAVKDQLDRVAPKLSQCLLARADPERAKSGLLQVGANQRADVRLVLDDHDQRAHNGHRRSRESA